MALILIGGGARSGKSRYALQLCREIGPRLAFVATAQAFDDEMRLRIRSHQDERGTEFVTFEEPYRLAELIEGAEHQFDAVLVDCLTLWLTNLMLAESYEVAAEGERLIATAAAARATIICVTNEVGCGIVPENALARRFRDEAGRLNQLAAARARAVYWMMFGCPLRVK